MDFMVNPKVLFYLAKKEFMDNIRNRWIIIITIIFTLLVLIFAFLAAGQTGSDSFFGDFQNSVLGLVAVSSFLLPLIAIILGHSTISGEVENGALSVVLTYPVRRIEVYFGKLLGLLSVIMFSVFVGFGFGGIIIAATAGGDKIVPYVGFMILSVLLGLIYLSIMLCVSSFTKKRFTSIALGIVFFFWSTIVGSLFLGIYLGSGFTLADLQGGNIPDWFFQSVVFSPMDLHQTVVSLAFDMTELSAGGFSITFPDFLNMGFLLIVHFIWILIPIIIGCWFFSRRDI